MAEALTTMSLSEKTSHSHDLQSQEDSPLNRRESSSENIKTDVEASPAPAPTLTFPEGGLQGWLTVAGGYDLNLSLSIPLYSHVIRKIFDTVLRRGNNAIVRCLRKLLHTQFS